MLKRLLSSAIIVGSLGIPISSSQETKIEGVRVDYAYDFIKGKGLVGEQKIEEAIGSEKATLYPALSLGVGGEVKVAYTRGYKDLDHIVCFYNIEGFDFFIHEPSASNNQPETIKVFVGLNKNPNKNDWVSFNITSVTNGVKINGVKTNYIPFDLDNNLEGINVNKGYVILVKDAKSMLTMTGSRAGFEMSTAIIKAPCNDFIASIEERLEYRLN